MKNEINWDIQDEKPNEMTLEEAGLDFSKKTAFFFYLSGFVATASLGWVMALSVRLIYLTSHDSSIPQYYITIAIACLVICAMTIHRFLKIFREKRAYKKIIKIKNGMVEFCEHTINGLSTWKEKVKKYDGVYLKHYSYRGVKSWYIALVHPEQEKSLPIFVPSFEYKDISEEEKRKLLARYGTQFGLLTTYEQQCDEAKKA